MFKIYSSFIKITVKIIITLYFKQKRTLWRNMGTYMVLALRWLCIEMTFASAQVGECERARLVVRRCYREDLHRWPSRAFHR